MILHRATDVGAATHAEPVIYPEPTQLTAKFIVGLDPEFANALRRGPGVEVGVPDIKQRPDLKKVAVVGGPVGGKCKLVQIGKIFRSVDLQPGFRRIAGGETKGGGDVVRVPLVDNVRPDLEHMQVAQLITHPIDG